MAPLVVVPAAGYKPLMDILGLIEEAFRVVWRETIAGWVSFAYDITTDSLLPDDYLELDGELRFGKRGKVVEATR